MLLEHDLLAVARIWQHRERIEREAADQFRRLASDLAEVEAAPAVIALARRAAADEDDHAERCRRLVDRFAPGPLPPLAPRRLELGPTDLPRRERTLYAAVAISCVTETLSAALLLRMRERAGDPLVRQTVHQIAVDEVAHSRLGWAHLASESARGDVGWLAPHVAPMLRAAVATDLEPMSSAVDLSAYGILSRSEADAITGETVAAVIAPGLERFGVAAPIRSSTSQRRPE